MYRATVEYFHGCRRRVFTALTARTARSGKRPEAAPQVVPVTVFGGVLIRDTLGCKYGMLAGYPL